MADKRVTVTLECIDNATKKIQEATKSIDNLSKKANNVSSKGIDKMTSGFKELQSVAKALNFNGLEKVADFAADAAKGLASAKNGAELAYQSIKTVI